ncbi:uncharacterized protein LOC143197243 [Rhynchophorus ferrugineus]|uniref:Tudor domain-containing protein n=1 Tax=Rhynchophorus ferrugineus TaxID=354439 RepID=A0A834IUK5_RHYFE|nr:hypothetical protein GWI33_001448 [Rhynchophorus ferrugineus]
MRYRVVVRLNQPRRTTPDETLPKSESETKMPESQSSDKPSESVKTSNPLQIENQQNCIVPNESEKLRCPVPRLRASLNLKVSPNECSKPTKCTNIKTQKYRPHTEYISNIGDRQCKVNLAEADSTTHNYNLPEYKPYPPPKPRLKPLPSNRSSFYDDKDFEIPLEESLQAVQDFIKREEELGKWKVGETILAKWKGNGLYYQATILEILISGVITVRFDSYDVREEINYRDMCKYCRKTIHFKKKQGKLVENTSEVETDIPQIIFSRKRNKKHSRKYDFVSLYKTGNKSRRKMVMAYYKKNRALQFIRKKMNTCHL